LDFWKLPNGAHSSVVVGFYATNQKVSGSRPDEVNEIENRLFIISKIPFLHVLSSR
jgi:hypothetical protein